MSFAALFVGFIVGYSIYDTRTEVILDYWLNCVLELYGKNADKFLLFNVVQVFR